MSIKSEDLLWLYIAGSRSLSEDEFNTLAQRAKDKDYLDQLQQRVQERANSHRFLRDHYAINSETDKAIEHDEALMDAERELAIVQYLRFSEMSDPI